MKNKGKIKFNPENAGLNESKITDGRSFEETNFGYTCQNANTLLTPKPYTIYHIPPKAKKPPGLFCPGGLDFHLPNFFRL